VSIQPDQLYEKQREALLPFEDALFTTLLASMPNCYLPLNDSTLWGSILRAAAMEMSRIEYGNLYDLVSIDPTHLTPPDIDRRFSAPLEISPIYPLDGQSDIAYKSILTGVLAAYPQGALLSTIEAVIAAYTDDEAQVEELYTQVGTNGVTEADRNTLRIRMRAAINPVTNTTSALDLATLSSSLYNAIDLTKPAHVGLDYAVVFGNGESFTALLAGITDTLEVIYNGIEASQLPSEFYLAPDIDPDTPQTTLSASGYLVSGYLADNVSAVQYAALPFDSFREEYETNPDGGYTLRPEALNDTILVDGTGAPTGVISTSDSVLAPQLDKTWKIKSDTLTIFELD
jgi:hypothetical protein